MKKIFLLSGLLLILVTGCFYSSEDKKYMNDLKQQASENAINYIQEKYGFSATAVETTVLKKDTGPVITITQPPTDNVIVEMEYDNKKFNVIITGKEKNSNGLDNYQADEIKNDILEYIEKKIGIKEYKYNIQYGKFYTSEKGYIYDYLNIKYNKKDIEKFLDDVSIYILLEYINEKNFKNIDIDSLSNVFSDNKLLLINYNSIDSYNKVNLKNYSIDKIDEDKIRKNAPNIKNAYKIRGLSKNYYEFNLKKIDDFYYLPLNDNDIIKHSSNKIENTDEWLKNHKATIISNTYIINNPSDTIYVYFPIENFKKYTLKNIGDIVSKDGHNVYTESYNDSDIIGDYYVIKIYKYDNENPVDTKFVLTYHE